jgi:hypothetical protein
LVFVFKVNAIDKDIERFIAQHQVPLVGVLTQENQQVTYLNRRPICIFIYDLDFSFDHRERTQYWRSKILKIAQNYKDQYTFAIADEQKMSSLLKEFGLEESDEDVNVGCYDSQGLKYRMNDDDEFTTESLEEFIRRLSNGKIMPYFKSQLLPKQPIVNGIRTLVRQNFHSIVDDSTKHVLVFFYAPW